MLCPRPAGAPPPSGHRALYTAPPRHFRPGSPMRRRYRGHLAAQAFAVHDAAICVRVTPAPPRRQPQGGSGPAPPSAVPSSLGAGEGSRCRQGSTGSLPQGSLRSPTPRANGDANPAGQRLRHRAAKQDRAHRRGLVGLACSPGLRRHGHQVRIPGPSEVLATPGKTTPLGKPKGVEQENPLLRPRCFQRALQAEAVKRADQLLSPSRTTAPRERGASTATAAGGHPPEPPPPGGGTPERR